MDRSVLNEKGNVTCLWLRPRILVGKGKKKQTFTGHHVVSAAGHGQIRTHVQLLKVAKFLGLVDRADIWTVTQMAFSAPLTIVVRSP